jgi:hypothetical protein
MVDIRATWTAKTRLQSLYWDDGNHRAWTVNGDFHGSPVPKTCLWHGTFSINSLLTVSFGGQVHVPHLNAEFRRTSSYLTDGQHNCRSIGTRRKNS